MDTVLPLLDELPLQVLRLMADTSRQLAETRRLLVKNAEVLEECRKLVLANHPEAARALAELGEEVAARVAECGPPVPVV